MSALVEVSPADQFNEELVRNVHPFDWRNPEASGRYNLVVVGAGTAGLVASAGAAILGARVALIERHLMGGDCLNYGCVPSKALLACSRAAHAVRSAADYGITVKDSTIDFAACMQRLRRLRAKISHHDSAERFRSLGAEVFIGDARFTGRDIIEVGGQKLTFSKAIIAAGARAAALPIPGLREVGHLTNETVWSLVSLPARLIVIGAGPIGCELAQAFRRLGSDVTMLTDGRQILPREDPDAAKILASRFDNEGIRVITEAQIHRAERDPFGKAVMFECHGELQKVVGDEILVAVGRAPNLEGMGLEAAGVEFDAKGVRVNDRLRTTNPRIYAAGDICSEYKFTHAAEAMARVTLQNALFFGRKKVSDLVIPWCTYTDPEIAHVGMYEREARDQRFAVETFTSALAENDRAIVDGQAEGFGRVHIDAKSGKILGATLVSPHAGETIGEFVLAIQRGLKLSDLSGVIHPYPTAAEMAKRLGDSSMKSRLKPWMKRFLTRFFEMRR
jgi:pyruvate/2-oxoglutarate dehydrogenase complex dihydrolipoamide dehydrogenase (E3) component